VRESGQLPALLHALFDRDATKKDDVGPNSHLFRSSKEALHLSPTCVDHEDKGKFVEAVVAAGIPLRGLQGLAVPFCFRREALQVEVAEVRVRQEIRRGAHDDSSRANVIDDGSSQPLMQGGSARPGIVVH
jgi:hypothetical protein